MFKKAHLSLTILFFALLGSAGNLSAQEQVDDTEQAQVTDSAAVIQPYAVTEIPSRFESTSQKLGSIRTLIQEGSVRAEVDSAISLFKTEFQTIIEDQDSAIYFSMSPRDLNSMIRPVKRVQGEFNGLKERFNSRLRDLNKEKLEIGRLLETWQMTYETLKDDPGAESLVPRMEEIIREVKTVQDNLDETLSKVLDLQSTISEYSIQVDNELLMLNQALEESNKRLLIQNREPLWNEFSEFQDTINFRQRIAKSLELEVSGASSFWTDYDETIILHILILLIMIGTTIYLSQQTSAIESKMPERYFRYLRILQKPISAALIPVILLTYWLYPNSVSIIYLAGFIIIIIPLLVLVMDNMDRHLVYLLILLIIAQVTEGFYNIFSYPTPWFRVILLVESILISAGYFLFTRQYRHFGKQGALYIYYVVLTIGRIGFILSFISIPANLIGYESLAQYLVRGTILSASFGLLLFVAGLVVNGIITLTIFSPFGQQFNIIKNYADKTHKNLTGLIRFLLLFSWLELALNFYNIDKTVNDSVKSFFTRSFSIGEAEFSIGAILTFFLVIYISVLISRFLRLLFEEEFQERFKFKAEVTSTVSILIRYSILSIGFLLAIAALGFGMDKLAIILGALGVGIGFGLQNIFNNLISGLILAFERPVKVGDIIEVSSLGLSGTVKEIGIRASIIRTWDETDVIVPNGNIISNEVVNWTLSDQVRRNTIDVGVAYGTDPNKVLEILINQAKLHENVMDRPEPFALFTEFGDSSLNFRVYFWTANYDNRLSTISQIKVGIDTAFKENNITIPFPQRDLHLKTVVPEAGEHLQNKKDQKSN